jgi:hypothetical protein
MNISIGRILIKVLKVMRTGVHVWDEDVNKRCLVEAAVAIMEAAKTTNQQVLI